MDKLLKILEAKDKELIDALPELFQNFMNANDINVLLIHAYTPSFNDGDECVHTQRSSADEYIMKDAVNEFNLCGLPDNSHKIPYDVLKEFDSEYEEILKRCFGTNWQMLLVRKGKDVQVLKQPYDPGY